MPRRVTRNRTWSKRCNEHARQYCHQVAWRELHSLAENLPTIVNRVFKTEGATEQGFATLHSVCQAASSSWRRKVRTSDSPARVHSLLCQRLQSASNIQVALSAVNEFTISCRRRLR